MKLKLFMYLPLLLLFLFLVSTLCFPLARNPKGKGRQKFKLKPLGRLPPFARSNRYHRYHDSPYPLGMGPKGGDSGNLYLRYKSKGGGQRLKIRKKQEIVKVYFNDYNYSKQLFF